MAENNRREIIRVFFITVLLFGAVIPVFFYTARKNIILQKQGFQEAARETKIILEDGAWVRVNINNAEARAEVARSAAKKTQGLSGRESLAEGDGMLFVFEEKGAYSFWNKDMRFGLDVIWIDGDVVVDISENMPAFQGAPVLLTPSAKGNMVWEVNAGFVKTHGIQKGDKVIIGI